MENLTFNKTKSTLNETLETIAEGYKVVSNIAVEAGVIKRLNGYVVKAEEANADMYNGNTISWNASKRNDKWGVSFDWVSNEENDILTDLIVAVVEQIAAEYTAE